MYNATKNNSQFKSNIKSEKNCKIFPSLYTNYIYYLTDNNLKNTQKA